MKRKVKGYLNILIALIVSISMLMPSWAFADTTGAFVAEVTSNIAFATDENNAYVEGGIASGSDSSGSFITKDSMGLSGDKKSYRGSINIADTETAGYANGNSYRTEIKGISDADGNSRLNSITVNGKTVTINDSDFANGKKINLTSLSGITGDADIYMKGSGTEKHVAVVFSGSQLTFSENIKISCNFEQKTATEEPTDAAEAAKAPQQMVNTNKEVTEKTAGNVTAKAELSFQYAGDYMLLPQDVYVNSDLAEKYGYIDKVDSSKNASALDMLVKAHELTFGADFSVDTKDMFLAVSDSGWVTTVMGMEGTSFGFAVNDDMQVNPQTGWGATISESYVNDGGKVNFFFYSDPNWGDYYTWFEQNGVSIKSIDIKQGEKVALDLKGNKFAWSSPAEPMKNIKLQIVDPTDQTRTDIAGAVTDENGHVEFTLNDAGKFYISAAAQNGEYITLPWLLVNVSGKNVTGLESLIIHSDYSPDNSNVLLKNPGDGFTSGELFNSSKSTYILKDINDDTKQLRFRAKPAEADAKVFLCYDGKETDITWTGGPSSYENFIKPGKNVFKIKVKPADPKKAGMEYTFNIKSIPSAKSINATLKDKTILLNEEFNPELKEYTMTLPEGAKDVTFNVAAKNNNYRITYNGAALSTVDTSKISKVNIGISVGEGREKVENTYTINLKRIKQSDLIVDAQPKDAIVKVYDAKGNELKPGKDGAFTGAFAEGGYTYTVTKSGYKGQTGQVPTEGGKITVILEKAPESGLTDVGSDWNSFRNDSGNMGITDAKTPIKKEDTSLLWSAKLGSGWSQVPSPQIIVDNSLVTMCGTEIIKLDLSTGKVINRGKMVSSPSYSYVSPTYANGMIFCPLSDGKIQAFDAKTLESLWVYEDALKGQAMSPVTYSNGYIYSGFWTGEANDAHYVCLSVTDEDKNNKTEKKIPTWIHRQAGGFYWAGSAAVGKYIIVGSDNGSSKNDKAAQLYVFDQETGETVSQISLDNMGDVRSSIAYEKETGRVFFTSKGGYLVRADFDMTTGRLSNLKKTSFTGESVSTPIVYKGKVYIGVGKGFGANENQNFMAFDAETLNTIFKVNLKGYPQCSFLMSKAYEADGYLCFYTTYNNKPGGISLIKVKNNPTSEKDAELIEIFEAKGFENFCMTSIICDKKGNLYYKNDSGNIMAVGLAGYKNVSNLIDKIGKVTLNSKTDIAYARQVYDALPNDDKTKVTNYQTLLDAEKKLAQLEAEAEAQSQAGQKPNANTNKTENTSSTKSVNVKLTANMSEKAKNIVEMMKNEASKTARNDNKLLEIYKAYASLEAAEKLAVEKTDAYKQFEKLTLEAGKEYHYDKKTGIDMRHNDEKLLPWYVKLVVTPEKADKNLHTKIKEILGEESKLFNMNNISFINMLDGSNWHPEGNIKVKMPAKNMAGFNTMAIVYVKDNGDIEVIECDLKDSVMEFLISDGGDYAAAGFTGTVHKLLSGEDESGSLMWILLGAAAALLLIILIVVRRRQNNR